jgi:hypothetical protein
MGSDDRFFGTNLRRAWRVMATFTSGAKSSEEQPRFDLIPFEALRREAIRMAEGARAHGENNYQQGTADPAFIRDRINHLLAHALKYANGDRSEDHLAAIRCNAGMLTWLDEHRSKVQPLDIAIPDRRYCEHAD